MSNISLNPCNCLEYPIRAEEKASLAQANVFKASDKESTCEGEKVKGNIPN